MFKTLRRNVQHLDALADDPVNASAYAEWIEKLVPHYRGLGVELDLLAQELQQPLYRHSSLTWRCVWAGLAGRFEPAHLYGDGQAGARIADVLARTPLRVQKRIQY